MAAQGAIYLPFLNSQLVSPFVDFDNDTIKVMLVTSGYTFDATHDFRDDITNETSGSNYPAGGIIITGIVSNTVGGTVTVTGADSTFLGASSTPFTFRAAIVYKDTGSAATDPVISFHDFGEDSTNDEVNVVLKWSTNFIASFSTVAIVQVLEDLADVNTATTTNRFVLVADGTDWESRLLLEDDISDLSHTTDASDLVSGVLADARVQESNVTQHEAALSLTESQISDLQPYMLDVVDDASPTLGGNLDVGGNVIFSVSNGDIVLIPNGTGNVLLGNFEFDADQTAGAGQDNFVLTFDNATGEISLEASAGGGGATELSDLTDVNTSTPTNRFVLVADGVDWESRLLVEDDVSNLQAYILDITGDPLEDLSDVTITSIAANELLKWTGTAWINNTLAEANISAVGHTHVEADITDLQPYLLDITGEPIADLSDVVITAVGDNELLAFDNGSGNWINQTPAEAGLSATGHTHVEADITDLQPYLLNVVQDTTPQLGGDLDVAGNSLVSTSNGDIILNPNGTGNVLLGNYTLDGDQSVGAGQDNFVFTYDNATGEISLEAVTSNVTELSDLTDVNTSTPTNRFVLVADGVDFESRLLTEADISDLQPYLLNIDEDTTPQLGGSLDVNGNPIVSTAAANITLTPDTTGNVVLGNFEFNADQTVGAGQDNFVLTYDNGTGEIGLEVTTSGVPSFPLLAPNGSASAPSYSFAANPSTGLFSTGSNITFSASNAARAILNASSFTVLNRILVPKGTETDPPYSFSDDTGSGMLVGANPGELKWSSDGVIVMQLSNTASGLNTTVRITGPASTTSRATFRVPHGVAPTAPNDGDIWSTTTDIFASIDGDTRALSTHFTLIEEGQVNSVASVNFIDLTTEFKAYKLLLSNVHLLANGANFNMQVSIDNGSTFVTTGVYSWALAFARIRATGGATTGAEGDFADNQMTIITGMGSIINEDGACETTIYNPLSTDDYTRISTIGTYLHSQPEHRSFKSGGTYNETTAVNAFRLIASTGNIGTLTFQLYGYK